MYLSFCELGIELISEYSCTNANLKLFTIRIHYGGRISWGTYVSYDGGNVNYIDICDAERMSIHEIKSMVQKLRNRRASILYYAHVNKFCAWTYKYKVMEMYCHHFAANEIDELKRQSDIEPAIEKKKSAVIIEDLDEKGCIFRELLVPLIPSTRRYNDDFMATK